MHLYYPTERASHQQERNLKYNIINKAAPATSESTNAVIGEERDEIDGDKEAVENELHADEGVVESNPCETDARLTHLASGKQKYERGSTARVQTSRIQRKNTTIKEHCSGEKGKHETWSRPPYVDITSMMLMLRQDSKT